MASDMPETPTTAQAEQTEGNGLDTQSDETEDDGMNPQSDDSTQAANEPII